MNDELLDFDGARRRAIERRASGTATDFDPSRLSLARRLAALPRTKLARAVEVSPAAIGQFEKGQSRPSLPVLAALADALEVPVEFFRAGHPIAALPASAAHFRSLRSTTATEREQALAFGELVLSVFAALELSIDLPAVALPELFDIGEVLDDDAVVTAARQTRGAMGLEHGPVPHVVRLLEAHGVAVASLDGDVSDRVDAFSHQQPHYPFPTPSQVLRPLVLLNPAKEDKARARFNAAHELGHLVMHHDTEPGSRLAEAQAHAFAAEFLTPANEIARQLPTRLDWVRFHDLKRQWGVSLKALVMRAHRLGRLSEHSYRRGMQQLAMWGYPEPGPLGDAEKPVLLPRAVELLGGDSALPSIARDAGLPLSEVRRVWAAAGGTNTRPKVTLLP